MKQDDIKTNLLDPRQWTRMLFMAGFAVAAWLVVLALIVLVLVQTLIVLVSGEPNRNLRRVGHLFGCYLQELVEYLCYNSNTRPFPFADFPAGEAEEAVAEEAAAEEGEPDADFEYAAAVQEAEPPAAPFDNNSPDADAPQDQQPR
jgi:hypothetical protein